MKVLVTGGAGFIGSHLAEAFLAQGWGVAVVDNLATGKRENVVRGASFHEADITDGRAMERIFAAERPDCVDHHAAQASVRVSTAEPAFDASVNVLGTVHLLVQAARHGAKQFVFASSGGALYGDDAPIPTPEDAVCRPASPYGVAKYAAEQYLGWAARALGLGCCALRYANVYGPRQDPLGEAGVIAIFIGRMLEGGQPVVNGDGLQTRDYVYVGDVVAANLAAVGSRLNGAYNIGCGIETDVNTLFDRLADLTGYAGTRLHGPALPGEQRRSCLDASRFRAACDWRPTHTLEQGLAKTVGSFRAAGQGG